jgi:HEPN domain-containing protein
MVDEQIVEEWLQKAKEDYQFACSVIEDSPFYAQICFHLHQSAVKYLKSLIIAYELEFKKIHDLPVLLKLCLDVDSELKALLEGCTFLNAFYIESRYPVHWPTEYTKEMALKAKACVEQISDVIVHVIGSWKRSNNSTSGGVTNKRLEDAQDTKNELSGFTHTEKVRK